MINTQKDLSSKKETKFNDFKVSPIWAVITIVFTLAILVNSGVIIYFSRLLTIQSESNKLYKNELKTNENIYNNGLTISNDEYYENFLKSILTESQLRTLAKSCWSYDFFANDKKIVSSKITVSKGNIVFKLVQKEQEQRLPNNIHILGSLTAGDKADRFYEHPMFSPGNYITTPPLANVNPAEATYEFKDAKSGDVITISLTPPLRERLGLTDSEITVTVK